MVLKVSDEAAVVNSAAPVGDVGLYFHHSVMKNYNMQQITIMPVFVKSCLHAEWVRKVIVLALFLPQSTQFSV